MRTSTDALQRYPEIDALRAFAILGMVIYHAVYDLWAFYDWDIDPFSTGWWLFARATAVIFLGISGMSNTIANARARSGGGNVAMWKRTCKRAAQIGAAAALISLVTYVMDPETYVRFGILHCIAVGVLLLPLFQQLQAWNALIGGLAVIAGIAFMDMTSSTSLLLPFGLPPENFSTLDYFPLLPWFGVMLLGNALSKILYLHNTGWLSSFRIPCPSPPCRQAGGGQANSAFSMLTGISRFSLLIYLVHQPMLLFVLRLLLGPL